MYNVYIQQENSWKLFGVFKAEDGDMALELARSSKIELLDIYNEEELPYVNLEYEEIINN